MEAVKIQNDLKINKELARENMSFSSTLKSLKELGYDYIKDLGVGKFGKVCEMIHPSTKTSCAVKFVKEEDISDGELYFWSSLCHRNILPLIGYNYIAKDQIFIFITKKCPSTLDQKLGEVEFIFDSSAFDRAVSWIRDVAMGIAYLHKQKMAHMDVKTNNILISDENRALVADFGSLSSTERPSSSYTSPLPYRPPETYGLYGSWEPVNGIKYDSWTFGMLCIRVFTRENFSQNVHHHKNFWPKKMYPLLFNILQKKSFVTKMKACFPRSQNSLLKADAVLSLIRSCLQLDQQKRTAVKEVLNHRLFGGPVFYKLEENSPWNRKADYEQIERLILELNVLQKYASVDAEECYETNSVTEKKVGAENKLLSNGNIGEKINGGSVEKFEETFADKEIKIDHAERVSVSSAKVTSCDRGDIVEKTVRSVFNKNTVFSDLELENQEECKTDKKIPAEVILDAHTLLKDVDSQHLCGIYLNEMDSRVQQDIEMKRTHRFVDWVRGKKNTFSKMFARNRSTK